MSFAVESRPPCALVKSNISAADGCHHHHCKRLYPDGPSIGFHVAIQPWLRSLSRFPCVLGPPIPGDDVLPHRGALGSRLPQLTISTFHLCPSVDTAIDPVCSPPYGNVLSRFDEKVPDAVQALCLSCKPLRCRFLPALVVKPWPQLRILQIAS